MAQLLDMSKLLKTEGELKLNIYISDWYLFQTPAL